MPEGKRRKIIVLLILAITISFTLFSIIKPAIGEREAHPDIWVEYKGGYSRTGYITHAWKEKNIIYRGFRVKWSFHAGLCVASSPVIADLNGDGLPDISFASCDGYEYALRADDGALLWKTRTGGGLVDPAAWDLNNDGYMDVIVGGATGILYCLNGSNGKIEWSVKGTFQRAIPTLYDIDGDGEKEVIVTSMSGDLYIIKPNGTIVKKMRIGESALSPPVVNVDNKNISIVTTDYHSLIVVNPVSWNVTKMRMPEDLGGVTPVLFDVNRDGSKDALIVGRDKIFAVDLKFYKILWSASFEGSGIASPSVGDALNNNGTQILFGTDNGLFVYSLNGTIIAEYHDERLGTASPIIVDIDNDGHNEVLLGTYDGSIIIADLTGKATISEGIKWELDTGAPIMAPPAIGDGDMDGMPEIYIGSRDYNMYCIDGITVNKTQQEINTSSYTNTSTRGTQSTTTIQKTTTIQNQTTTHITETITKTVTITSKKPNYTLVSSITILLLAIATIIYIWSRRT